MLSNDAKHISQHIYLRYETFCEKYITSPLLVKIKNLGTHQKASSHELSFGVSLRLLVLVSGWGRATPPPPRKLGMATWSSNRRPRGGGHCYPRYGFLAIAPDTFAMES